MNIPLLKRLSGLLDGIYPDNTICRHSAPHLKFLLTTYLVLLGGYVRFGLGSSYLFRILLSTRLSSELQKYSFIEIFALALGLKTSTPYPQLPTFDIYTQLTYSSDDDGLQDVLTAHPIFHRLLLPPLHTHNRHPTTLTALGNFNHTSPEGARLITLCSSPQPSSPLDEACSTLLGGGGGGGPSLITKRDCNWQGDNISRQCHDNVAQCYYCDEGDIVQDDFGVALACASCLIK
ncbi:hypothetical protein V8F06_013782 [Rhypophila decipiens]